MALSKPTTTFFTHLKTLAKPHHHHPPSFLSLRLLSFATPEDAAADRRQRKRRLRMEPPVSALRHNQQQQHRRPPHSPIPNPNPNAPKLPEHVSVLTGKRLDLHNRILTLIRQNDLEEAALLTRHSIYSNCKPTIFTCNSVMAALLRQSKYSDLLSLHRFITQAGVSPNVITHNLIINVYCDCRKTDTALEHYKQLINNAPFNPSPTTYRILVKGLVDNGKVERAVELKDEMHEKGFAPDPLIYGYLMSGLVKKEDSESADGVLALYDELQSKSGGFVSDGVVSGSLMKAYFRKGMEKEAMECYEEALSILNNSDASKSYSDSSVGVRRMGAVAYNWVLDALIKNGKFDNALQLFDKMMERHEPPRRLTVNLGSFNVMVDWFCAQGKFQEAIEVFRKMGEKRCSADTLSYNNLIQQLCENGMVAEAEELYQDLVSHDQVGPKPDEFTYVLLMDACFGQNRADDAAGYFTKMVDPSSGLKPNLVAYKKVVDGLIKAGKIDEAKGFFDQMAEKLNLEAADYEVMLRALCDAEGKLDEVLKMIDAMLDDETLGGLTSEMNEFVTDALRKEGREEELGRLVEEKERKREAEALAKKKAEEEKAAAANNVTATVSSARTLAMLSGASGVNGNVAVSESILGGGGNVSSADQQVVGEAPGLVDTGVVDEATKADDLAEQPKNVDDGVA